MKKLLVLLFASIFLASCGSLRDFADVKEPDVTFTNMSIQNITFEGVTLLFDFDINNPNRFGVSAESYNYEFFINERSFLTGVEDQSFKIERESSNQIQIPVSLSFTEVYETFRSVMRQDSLSYMLSSEVEFDMPVMGSRKVPVTANGSLPIPKIPRIQFGEFNVKEISLSGANVEVSFRVSNPNAFGISIANAKYMLNVNGRQWLDTQLDERIYVDGSEQRVITIPVRLSATQMGSAMVEIMSGNSTFNYKLTGSAEVSAELEGFVDGQLLPFELEGVYDL